MYIDCKFNGLCMEGQYSFSVMFTLICDISLAALNVMDNYIDSHLVKVKRYTWRLSYIDHVDAKFIHNLIINNWLLLSYTQWISNRIQSASIIYTYHYKISVSSVLHGYIWKIRKQEIWSASVTRYYFVASFLHWSNAGTFILDRFVSILWIRQNAWTSDKPMSQPMTV